MTDASRHGARMSLEGLAGRIGCTAPARTAARTLRMEVVVVVCVGEGGALWRQGHLRPARACCVCVCAARASVGAPVLASLHALQAAMRPVVSAAPTCARVEKSESKQRRNKQTLRAQRRERGGGTAVCGRRRAASGTKSCGSGIGPSSAAQTCARVEKRVGEQRDKKNKKTKKQNSACPARRERERSVRAAACRVVAVSHTAW